MIGEHLNLKAESLIGVFLPRETDQESHEAYKQAIDEIMKDYSVHLTNYMTEQKLTERAHACQTLEELQKLEYKTVPDDFMQELINRVNAKEDLSDPARIFLLVMVSDRIMFSAKQYCDTVLRQRAQVIVKQKPKIIT